MVPSSRVRVAVIPARGGSKRLPRKNIRKFDGMPLIAWSIRTCVDSGIFDRVVVSTDDTQIAEIAAQFGAEIPFLREPDLADDHTSLGPVVHDALDRLDLHSDHVDACCVYPTSVGTTADDLEAALGLLDPAEPNVFVVGVVRYSHPIQRAMLRDNAGALTLVDPKTAQTRTQDLDPTWHDAGQFIWGSAAAWCSGVPILASARGFELPGWRAIDIDNEDDWTRAEHMHRISRSPTLR